MRKKLLKTMVAGATLLTMLAVTACGNTETGRSEERRVGKEC